MSTGGKERVTKLCCVFQNVKLAGQDMQMALAPEVVVTLLLLFHTLAQSKSCCEQQTDVGSVLTTVEGLQHSAACGFDFKCCIDHWRNEGRNQQ